jgi:hypothetical protein
VPPTANITEQNRTGQGRLEQGRMDRVIITYGSADSLQREESTIMETIDSSFDCDVATADISDT